MPDVRSLNRECALHIENEGNYEGVVIISPDREAHAALRCGECQDEDPW